MIVKMYNVEFIGDPRQMLDSVKEGHGNAELIPVIWDTDDFAKAVPQKWDLVRIYLKNGETIGDFYSYDFNALMANDVFADSRFPHTISDGIAIDGIALESDDHPTSRVAAQKHKSLT